MKIEIILPDGTNFTELLYAYPVMDAERHINYQINTMKISRPENGETYVTDECDDGKAN